ncbi:hypothetical protein GYB22_01000 [bacterium]|nr:hypothetical protein [bacterium]
MNNNEVLIELDRIKKQTFNAYKNKSIDGYLEKYYETAIIETVDNKKITKEQLKVNLQNSYKRLSYFEVDEQIIENNFENKNYTEIVTQKLYFGRRLWHFFTDHYQIESIRKITWQLVDTSWSIIHEKIISKKITKLGKDGKSKPPYLTGLLGLIPLIGFFVGCYLTVIGIFKFKDTKLTIIGIACMAFTVIVYSSIFFYGMKSEDARQQYSETARNDLNYLVVDVEFYHLIYDKYPDSLEQLSPFTHIGAFIDPIQQTNLRDQVKYMYRNIGGGYTLFSLGEDGMPQTSDDIYPIISYDTNKIGWRKY